MQFSSLCPAAGNKHIFLFWPNLNLKAAKWLRVYLHA